MSVNTILLETLLMMGFTIIVGMCVAYLIKIMLQLFIFSDVTNITKVIIRHRAQVRSKRCDRARVRESLAIMEQSMDIGLLSNLYENVAPPGSDDCESKVKSLYDISRFRGAGDNGRKKSETSQNENTEDSIPLIKFYHGEV